MQPSEKLCPVCTNKNDFSALICIHCGAPLGDGPQIPTVTALSPEDSSGGVAVYPGIPLNEDIIPAGDVAFHVFGVDKTVYIHIEDEIVLGRKVDQSDASLLDLRELGGYQMGLSRRHAKIRRSGAGYEIIDLHSTNGTWLDNARLVPERAYPIASGSQLKLGHMRLYFLYRPVSEGKQP